MQRVTIYREFYSNVRRRSVDLLIDHALLTGGRITGTHNREGQDVAEALGEIDGMGMHPVSIRGQRYFASVYQSER